MNMVTNETEFNQLKEIVENGKSGNELCDSEYQFQLGYCYYAGKGTPKNLIEAEKWYRKAETFLSSIDFEKFEEAKRQLGRVKFFLSVSRQLLGDESESARLFKESLALGCPEANQHYLETTDAEIYPIRTIPLN